MNNPLSKRGEEFLKNHPHFGAALKSAHDRGLTTEQAAHDPEVKEGAHKDGFVTILAILAFIAVFNELWDFWNNVHNI